MGGSMCTVVVKESVITSQRRGTNSLPEWSKTKNLFVDPDSWLQEFLDAGRNYAVETSFSPFSYGIAVFDLDRKLILSCNDYFTPDYLGALAYIERKYDWLFEEGRVKTAEVIHDSATFEYKPTGDPISKSEFPEVYRSIDDGQMEIMADLSPFTVKNYFYNKAGILSMQSDVKKLYGLSAEEEKEWLEFSLLFGNASL